MELARRGDYSGLMQQLDDLIQAKKRNELLAEYEKHVGVLSEEKQGIFYGKDSKTDSMLEEEQKKQKQRLNGIERPIFAIPSDVNANMYNSEDSMFPVEYITFEKPIGKAYNYGTKEWVDVSKVAVKYSKTGVHISPCKGLVIACRKLLKQKFFLKKVKN